MVAVTVNVFKQLTQIEHEILSLAAVMNRSSYESLLENLLSLTVTTALVLTKTADKAHHTI